MTLAFLVASRAKWRAREVRAYRVWRGHVKHGAPMRVRSESHAAWESAHKQRVRRDRQIAGRHLAVTHCDAEGVEFIRREEGFKNRPYNDSRGFATVGVGHLLHMSSYTAADVRKWTLTDKEVDTLLSKDLARFEKVVRKVLKRSPFETNHHVFNACCSLAFNIGIGGFITSSAAKALHAGKKSIAARAFLLWSHPSELLPRRRREVVLLNK